MKSITLFYLCAKVMILFHSCLVWFRHARTLTTTLMHLESGVIAENSDELGIDTIKEEKNCQLWNYITAKFCNLNK